MANSIKLIRQGAGDTLYFNTEVVGENVAGENYPVVSSGIKKAIDEATDKDLAKDYIVLKSSTASSTKKFKITVVDNGTISATEITE